METIEGLLSKRFPRPVKTRLKIAEVMESAPTPISKLVRRQLFRWPYRHLRESKKDVQFRSTDDYGWEISGENLPIIKLEGLPKLKSAMKSNALIVASGPSSRDYDYNAINRQETSVIAVSGSISFLAERNITPDCWIISDNNFPKLSGSKHFDISRGVPLVTTHVGIAHVARLFPEHLTNRKIFLIERINQWHGLKSLKNAQLEACNQSSGKPFHFPEGMNGKSVTGWSHRPEQGIFSGDTVVFVALQILIACGTNEIDIVGMDLSNQTRCYDEGNNPIPNQLVDNYEMHILPSFQLMNKALRGRPIKIKNLSESCPLPGELFNLSDGN